MADLREEEARDGIAIAAVALLTSGWFLLGGQKTVTVRERDGELVAERTVEVGAPRFRMPGGTRIVNETSSELWLVGVTYAANWENLLGPGPPNSTIEVRHSIEWLGPDQEPPQEIRMKSSEDRTRYWLTWE